MAVRKEHDSLDEDQKESKMQMKEVEPTVFDIEKHSIPPHESESIEKNNGIFGLLEMCGVKKSRTESNANPHLVMDDHPTGRLLPRTVGTDEIEEERLSISNCLSSPMKYESRTESNANPYLIMDDHPTGRLLPRTVGTDEIEEERLSTSNCLSSQMKYEYRV